MVLDATTGKVLNRRTMDFCPSFLVFTKDGTGLLAYGQPLGADPGKTKPGPPRVLLMDAVSLAVRWEQTLPAIVSGEWWEANCNQLHESQVYALWSPAVVFAAEQNALLIVHADADRLTTVDVIARTVRTVEIRQAQSWWERLLAWTAGVAVAKGNDNGQPVLLASQPGQQSTQLALLDPRSFAIVHAWTVQGYATWVTRP